MLRAVFQIVDLLLKICLANLSDEQPGTFLEVQRTEDYLVFLTLNTLFDWTPFRAECVLSCVGASLQLRGSSVAKEAPKKLEVYVDDTLVLCEPGTTLLQVRLKPSTLPTP